jgi:hypothetical protein
VLIYKKKKKKQLVEACNPADKLFIAIDLYEKNYNGVEIQAEDCLVNVGSEQSELAG